MAKTLEEITADIFIEIIKARAQLASTIEHGGTKIKIHESMTIESIMSEYLKVHNAVLNKKVD